jgi:hypothetical protein
MKYMTPIRIPAPMGVDFRDCKTRIQFCNKIDYCNYVQSCSICMFGINNKSHFDKLIKEVKR